jgi:TetR/AcrR family acrAB operon transcriptional repressor
MARCTKEEALETRSRILDAAEQVFHANGVARTSLSDVADAASVTRGAIYWHFKNKTDLLEAMCDRVRLPMEARIAAGNARLENDPLGQLKALCVFFFHDMAGNPHSRMVLDIMFHKCEYVDAYDLIALRQRECFSRCRDNFETMIGAAVARGQLPARLDVKLASVMFHAAFDGLLNSWLFAPDSFDLAGNAERLVDACIDSLRHGRSLLESAQDAAPAPSLAVSAAAGWPVPGPLP